VVIVGNKVPYNHVDRKFLSGILWREISFYNYYPRLSISEPGNHIHLRPLSNFPIGLRVDHATAENSLCTLGSILCIRYSKDIYKINLCPDQGAISSPFETKSTNKSSLEQRLI
jgi:hypothetical protein